MYFDICRALIFAKNVAMEAKKCSVVKAFRYIMPGTVSGF